MAPLKAVPMAFVIVALSQALACAPPTPATYCDEQTPCSAPYECESEHHYCYLVARTDGGPAEANGDTKQLVDRSSAQDATPADSNTPPDGPGDAGLRDLFPLDLGPRDSTQDRLSDTGPLEDYNSADNQLPDIGSEDAGPATCNLKDDCNLGCDCQAQRCVPLSAPATQDYCSYQQSPTCITPTFTVSDAVDGAAQSLRSALVWAANNEGPQRIVFDPSLTDGTLHLDSSLGPLPSVTSLTFIDAPNIFIYATADSHRVGLRLEGTGIAVQGLGLSGFTESAVVIAEDSQDHHLWNMTIGDPDATSNGHGIDIQPGSRYIYIGRGRELECVDHHFIDIDSPDPLPNYDINMIIGGSGDGIRAEQTSHLYIYGTWVGFSLRDSQHPASAWANGGIGIRLLSVEQAVVGVNYLDAQESGYGLYDPRVGGVAVGRSLGGGVLIDGGGHITLPNLMLGITPTMIPFDENRSYNLTIRNNTAPVIYGRPLGESSAQPPLFGMSYTSNYTPISITSNAAEVTIWGVQSNCFGSCSSAVEIREAGAAVNLYNMTFVDDFYDAVVTAENFQAGGVLRFRNNLIFHTDQTQSTPILSTHNILSQNIAFSSNLKSGFGSWCAGVCPNDQPNNQDVEDYVDSCDMNLAQPRAPDCEVVDEGEELTVGGLVLDRNGALPGTYNACASDIGFYECASLDCLSTVCN